jgi:hypothetical protein
MTRRMVATVSIDCRCNFKHLYNNLVVKDAKAKVGRLMHKHKYHEFIMEVIYLEKQKDGQKRV